MKFVVAVDGSEQSDRALDHAVEMARAADAALVVVHSVSPDVYDVRDREPVDGISDAESLVVESVADAEERGERILEEAAETVAAADVPVEREILYGEPLETVPEYASDVGADGIFVGHRGLSESAERVLGSVAKGLVERADVPVTVVH